MKQTQLSASIHGVILALTKFETVVHSMNDDLIHDINSPVELEQGETLNPLAEVETPVIDTPSTDLDDENCPWDIRIHAGESAEKCSQVASKTVKGGKAWRMRKGCDKAEYETIKAELIGGITTTDGVNETKTVSAPVLPGKTAPSLPAKTMPGLPAVKGAVDETSGLRKTTIVNMQALVSKFDVDYEDIKEIMLTEFDAAQNGDEVTFGGLHKDQYQAVHDFFAKLVNQYSQVQTSIDEARKAAGVDQTTTINDHVTHYLNEYNTESVGGIHHSQLDGAIGVFKEWCDGWVAWAKG